MPLCSEWPRLQTLWSRAGFPAMLLFLFSIPLAALPYQSFLHSFPFLPYLYLISSFYSSLKTATSQFFPKSTTRSNSIQHFSSLSFPPNPSPPPVGKGAASCPEPWSIQGHLGLREGWESSESRGPECVFFQSSATSPPSTLRVFK